MGEPDDGGDDALLVAARTDPAAFGDLFDRRHDQLIGFFYRRTGCPHLAAELTAETFARAWASRHQFDPAAGSAMGWIVGIAANLHHGCLRKGAVRETARRRLGGVTPVRSEDDLDQIERTVDLLPMRDALRRALEELSPTLREAVVLRVACDLPYQEVAARLGCSTGAARVRVSRGLDALLPRIDPHAR